MLQKHSDFFFSRPFMYYGAFQEMHVPYYEIDPSNLLFPLILDVSNPPTEQKATGLFLQWPDCS